MKKHKPDGPLNCEAMLTDGPQPETLVSTALEMTETDTLISSMPDTDPGMAFLLVGHLAPDHESIFTDLVRRYTRQRAVCGYF